MESSLHLACRCFRQIRWLPKIQLIISSSFRRRKLKQKYWEKAKFMDMYTHKKYKKNIYDVKRKLEKGKLL